MARSRDELLVLLENLRGWYKQDFNEEYKLEALKTVMEQQLEERLRKFLYRRIGHLPDHDFLSFVSLFLHDERVPVFEEAPKVTAPKKKSLNG